MAKNLLLIFISIILTLIFLEGFLRLAGVIFLWQQEHSHTQLTLKEGEYRILCIGESTTALGGGLSYPSQLERLLNTGQDKYQFVVINKGIPSIDTNGILRELPGYIAQYRPHMIVAMMGINDHAFYAPGGWNNFKVVKLIRMIIEHSRHKLSNVQKTDNPFHKAAVFRAQGDFDESIKVLNELGSKIPSDNTLERMLVLWELAESYKCKGDFLKAIEYFQAVLTFTPDHNQAWGDMGDCYLLIGQLDKAHMCLTKQLMIAPKETWFYSKLVSTLEQLKREKEIEPLLKYGLRMNPDSTDILIELGHFYNERGRYPEAEEALEKVLKIAPKGIAAYNSDIVSLLKDIYIKTGEKEKLNQLIKSSRIGIGMKTQNNFERLKEITLKNNIELVIMQYPMRALGPLKDSVGSAPNIMYLDNEQIFKDAVSKEGYATYFIDRFAGNFGHATPKGNYLLGLNLAQLILNYLSAHQ